jgi:hypothetical protein
MPQQVKDSASELLISADVPQNKRKEEVLEGINKTEYIMSEYIVCHSQSLGSERVSGVP